MPTPTPPASVPSSIRLRWRLPHTGLFGQPVEGHWRWEADTPATRAAFQTAVDAGNRAHGPGTHWVEAQGDGACDVCDASDAG